MNICSKDTKRTYEDKRILFPACTVDVYMALAATQVPTSALCKKKQNFHYAGHIVKRNTKILPKTFCMLTLGL